MFCFAALLERPVVVAITNCPGGSTCLNSWRISWRAVVVRLTGFGLSYDERSVMCFQIRIMCNLEEDLQGGCAVLSPALSPAW